METGIPKSIPWLLPVLSALSVHELPSCGLFPGEGLVSKDDCADFAFPTKPSALSALQQS